MAATFSRFTRMGTVKASTVSFMPAMMLRNSGRTSSGLPRYQRSPRFTASVSFLAWAASVAVASRTLRATIHTTEIAVRTTTSSTE